MPELARKIALRLWPEPELVPGLKFELVPKLRLELMSGFELRLGLPPAPRLMLAASQPLIA